MLTDSTGAESRPQIGFRELALTVVVTVGLAFGIIAVVGKQSLVDLLGQGRPWPVQLAWGLVIGVLLSVPLISVVRRVPWFAAFHRQMIDLISRVDLSGWNPLWISLCAGVGEELLFRGALQPLAGLWVTSLIFTVVHFQTGQFRRMNRWKALYAFFVFVVSLGLGAECVRIGLIAAIVTHTVVDIIALTSLRAARRAQSSA